MAITREGDFVLVRQYRHTLGVTAMEICAGVMEQGEEPMQASQRELLEETGYGNGTWRPLMTIAPNPGTMTNRCHTPFLQAAHAVQPASALRLAPSRLHKSP